MSVESIVKSQRLFFNTNKTKDPSFRKDMLEKLLKTIEEKEGLISDALYKDLSKCSTESYIYEIVQVKLVIKNYIKNLEKWSKPEKRRTPLYLLPSRSYIYKEPYGTVLILSPWNYPFYLSLSPLIAAVAAGNCVVLKMSRKCPRVAEVVGEIIYETFSSNYVNMLNPEIDYAKINSVRYDFIFFTGSQRVGRMIMRQASEYLTPVVMELGGKTPCFIDSNVNLKEAARKIAWGKLINAGQTCVAPDYCLVPASLHDEFIELLEKEFHEMIPNAVENDDYGKIVNLHHYIRLKNAIEKAKNVIGGSYNDKNNKIAPAIFPNSSFKDDIMSSEIFGPILSVIPYEDIEEILISVKMMDKPLACYIFSNDLNFQSIILNEISFGGGCINDTILQIGNDNLPFGGVGNSGIGKYHGKDGFDTFSHEKSIMKKGFFSNFLYYPPYSEKKMKWISYILK